MRGGGEGASEMYATSFGMEGAVTQDDLPCLQHTVCPCFVDVSLSCYVDMWQHMTVMANNGPHTETRTHTYVPLLDAFTSAHAHTHGVSDGFAIDRATEIIKCCPTGSSIRH